MANNQKIAIIGLGYVGLPLAVEFGKKYNTIGYDINLERVLELSKCNDVTNEVSTEELKDTFNNGFLTISSNIEELTNCNFFIITVPTPIDQFKAPDLRPLISASKMIGSILKKGDIVIYESTVYPGCTEDDCVPVLEKYSKLIYNKDFFCGYSPERINPGDKINTLTKIKKVTSGSNPVIGKIIDELYKSIIIAGTHLAPNIKVAEASKAIENAQRDINISFVNELALIFDRMNIDTHDVLEAAGTKWNFLKYQPGLVGGHCIGVDPYYLAHKAQSLGYHPEVILSGRRVNDNMGMFIANKVIKLLIQKDEKVKDANILILGITFKENCPDIRNSRVIDIVKELIQFGVKVDIYDPIADCEKVQVEYGIQLIKTISKKYHGIVLAVSHNIFLSLDIESLKFDSKSIIFDTKSFLSRELVDSRL